MFVQKKWREVLIRSNCSSTSVIYRFGNFQDRTQNTAIIVAR